jgi:hypothetical protein
MSLATIIVGAATYPAFEALDSLNAAGVPFSKMFVHLGHTRPSGTIKHPTVRFHPMLHSKIYYMELPGAKACAFIGSHNMTSFALNGLNGEAGVLLEGDKNSVEFEQIRNHIEEARSQAVQYSPGMKQSLAWWAREFLDGLKAEIKLPTDWSTGRTILIFAQAEQHDRPASGDELYFEIPSGIEQIESLKTEAHLFLFETLPANPWEALRRAAVADGRYTCRILGADNKQGNREVETDWQIEGKAPPILNNVPSRSFRPATSSGMQQVRAEVLSPGVLPFEYLFEQEKVEWEPEYSDYSQLYAVRPSDKRQLAVKDDPDDRNPNKGWSLVKGLVRRDERRERDQLALQLASPDSGSFILVSLRRRRRN